MASLVNVVTPSSALEEPVDTGQVSNGDMEEIPAGVSSGRANVRTWPKKTLSGAMYCCRLCVPVRPAMG